MAVTAPVLTAAFPLSGSTHQSSEAGVVSFIPKTKRASPRGDQIGECAHDISGCTGRGAPPVASTKSLTGHSLGATGVHEAIYALLMMQGGFIAASANITTLDSAIDASEIVMELREGVTLDSVLSNSFGFGGTNATLLMSRYLG